MRPALRLAAAVLLFAGCSTGPDSDPQPIGTASRGICTGGCDASVYWDNIPSTLDVGERVRVTIKMMNTGTDTWDAGFALHKLNDIWGWDFVASAVRSSPATTATSR